MANTFREKGFLIPIMCSYLSQSAACFMHSGFLLHIISNYAFQILCGSPHNVCNDEGILLGMPYNRSVPGGYGGVFGPFFVCGLGEEDFCSLTPEQVKSYKKEFHCAEILIGATGNTPITMKVQPKAVGSPGQEKSRNDPPGRE